MLTMFGRSSSTGATPTASGSGAPSGSSNASATVSGASPSSTSFPGGAGSLNAGPVTGIFAVVVGVAAWFL